MSAHPPAVPTWRRVLRWAYLVGVVGAFVVAVVARRAQLAEQLTGLEPGPLALSVAAGVVGVGVSGLVWRRMLHGLGSALPLGVAAKVFFVSQLGKYLPGSLWPVLAQAEMGRDHDVPRRSAIAAQTLFMWVHLVTGAILGLPVLAAIGLVPRWVGVTPLLLVLLLFPRPLTAVMDALLKRLGRLPLPGRPGGRDMAAACGWAAVMWLLYGLHVHFAIAALDLASAGARPVLAAIGVFAAAWSAGFVVLIAPAGAGARELVLIAGLSTITAPETAFTATLLSRLVLSLADGLWGGAGILVGVGRGRRGDPSAPSHLTNPSPPDRSTH
ncbi:MAG TPA: lysylphosphatidylglycerol synthase domain-containing protein [Euzebya sp.]|nr:lysylphosphatidylglycerol synthase domain-containing protein [Euzebya sp.]